MIMIIKGYVPVQVTSWAVYSPPSADAAINEITAVADVAGSLNNKFFHIFSANNAVAYTVWFNVSSGGTAPLVQTLGSVLVEIAISTNDSATTIATALQTVLDALSDFDCIVSSPDPAAIVLTNGANGTARAAQDPNKNTKTPPASATGFGFVLATPGADGIATPSGVTLVQVIGTVADVKAIQNGNQFNSPPFGTRVFNKIINERLITEIYED